LELLALQAAIGTSVDRQSKDAAKIALFGLRYAEGIEHDFISFGTARRLQIDDHLIGETEDISTENRPDKVFIAADGTLGQEVTTVANEFHATVLLTGISLTKLNGHTRASAALSMEEVTAVPIRYMGMGEKIEAIDLCLPRALPNKFSPWEM
jgi:signal recognition particle subunit SRP54